MIIRNKTEKTVSKNKSWRINRTNNEKKMRISDKI